MKTAAEVRKIQEDYISDELQKILDKIALDIERELEGDCRYVNHYGAPKYLHGKIKK